MKIVGYTTGVFDLFHIGHLNILRTAKSYCDYLIVGVTTDELCFERKGKRPVISFAERAEIVSSIKFVDEVMPETDMDRIRAAQRIGFHRFFKGDDWKGTPEWNVLEQRFKELGIEVVFLPYTLNTSSTLLRKLIENSVPMLLAMIVGLDAVQSSYRHFSTVFCC